MSLVLVAQAKNTSSVMVAVRLNLIQTQAPTPSKTVQMERHLYGSLKLPIHGQYWSY